jgi:hypothetical protein
MFDVVSTLALRVTDDLRVTVYITSTHTPESRTQITNVHNYHPW